MKKIFLFILIFASVASYGQNNHTVTQSAKDSSKQKATTEYVDQSAYLQLNKPVFLGTLYSKNNWANTGDFTLVGSPTFAASGGHLTLSGGTQGPSAVVGTTNTAFNQVIKNTAYGYSMLERWKMTDTVVINNTPGSTTYGFGIGTYSVNSSAQLYNAIGYFNASTNTGTGTVSLLLGISNITAAISPSAITFSNGDTIILAVERIADRITVSAQNVHTKSPIVSCSYVWNFADVASTIIAPNTSNFSIVNFGGSYIINTMGIESNEVINSNMCMVGDSKFMGIASAWDLRIGSILNRYFPGTITSSGGSDKTQDVINHLNEIISLKPQKVVLCIGRNDLALSVAIGTIEANLDTIAARLNRAGIPFYSLDAIYETTQSQTSLINFLDTAVLFSGKLIQTYAPSTFSQAIGFGDNIHPSYLGVQAVTDAIRNYFYLSNPGQFLNDRFPIRSQDAAFNSAYILGGNLNMNGYSTSGTLAFYNPTTALSGRDIIMAGGMGITAAYGSSANTCRFMPISTVTGAMEFASYVGSGVSVDAIDFYTSGGTPGAHNLMLSLTQGKYLRVGGSVAGSVTPSAGDIIIPRGSALRANNSADGKHETAIVLQSTVTADMEFHQYDSAAGYRWYTNPVPSTGLNQVTKMQMFTDGNLAVGDSTNPGIKLWVNGGIGANKDSISITSAASAVSVGYDTILKRFVRFATGGGSASSGTYTSTFTNTTNIASSSLNHAYYTQIGNIVHVSIAGAFTPSVTLTSSLLTVSLPVNTVTTTQNMVGVGSFGDATSPAIYSSGLVSVNAAGTAQFYFTSVSTSACNFSLQFDYKIN